ncbi:DUF2550 domain-containing protein [Corynebacterium marinum]|uniref:Secreted protein n=1 Tax=Corynebacterium marinum DSM 44953 TaxID=1224162 RepID=A0A0B6TF64_9CORY|nr:DUF2550 domain-containing protein [Corynebacterium marinum]AJK68637.1 hypothetical protein B840_05105 [Corynebacterium marinum DSM 44953]GGO14229.1 hypothetical protein GCM10010980_08430 [Corynebacterium marinum]
MEIVAWVLIVLAVLAVLLAIWRLLTLRSRGSTILLRTLPASGVHGWRHGMIRYNGDDLEYFKLRSISPMADQVFTRQRLEFHEPRKMTPEEEGFMSEGLAIATLCDGGSHYELALDQHGLMALTAWIESAPHARQERIDHHRLRSRITRGQSGK